MITTPTASSSPICRLLRIAWLFQKNDIKTWTIPSSLFGILGAFSGSMLTTNQSPDYLAILLRLPIVLLWICLASVVFNMANQRLPASVLEDTLNKPHRPVPSGLVTPDQLRQAILVLVLPIIGWSYCLGVGQQMSFLFVIVWLYCDMEGGDSHFAVRNGFLAMIYGTTYYCSLRIATGPIHVPTTAATYWIGMLAMVIFTTLHIQDYRDEEGDAAKGRGTIPVRFSAKVARILFALPMTFWMIFIPTYWQLPILGWALCIVPGVAAVMHLLLLRGPEEDERAYQIWAVWTLTLFFVPFLKSQQGLLPF